MGFQVKKCLRGKTKCILATMHRTWCNNSSERRAITYATLRPRRSDIKLWENIPPSGAALARCHTFIISMWCSRNSSVKKCSHLFHFFFFLGAPAFPQPSSLASLSGFLAFSQNASGETQESKHEESAAGRGVRVGGRTDEERRK